MCTSLMNQNMFASNNAVTATTDAETIPISDPQNIIMCTMHKLSEVFF
jgi:hypothetical protein